MRQSRPSGAWAILLVVLVLQAAMGYVQYLNNIPELLVGFHIAGATLVWSAAVWFSLGLTVRDGPAEQAVTEGQEPSPLARLTPARA